MQGWQHPCKLASWLMEGYFIKAFAGFLRIWLRTLVPFREWIGELRDGHVLRSDILAGITVAMVLIPQSMAYAQLAGLPAHYGLYASFLPPAIAALLGSSRQLQTGPVAVVSLLTAAALEPIAGSNPEGYIAYAILLALMVGIFQIMLGLFRLGELVDFLSHPVVMGFTNAAALIIASSQLNKLFGVSVESATAHYETVWRVLVAIFEQTHWSTTAMSVISICMMWYLGRHYPRIPNVLIAVIFTTILSYLVDYAEKGGAIVGAIPAGLPDFAIPAVDFSVAGYLVSTAFVISLVGFMEAISIAKAMAVRTRQRLDANQELVGQGVSNLASAFSQGYPVSGSFSRSAVNINNNAVTGFSSVVTGAVVGIALLFFTPVLYHLPQATLASVIIMAVIKLFRIQPIVYAWKVQPHDAIVAIATFFLTVLSRHSDDTLRDAHAHILKTCNHISVLRFDGSLYFANAGYFEDRVLERIAVKPDLKYILIDAEGINEIDATGEEMLHELITRLEKLNIELVFARTKAPLIDTFNRTGLTRLVGGRTLFRTRTLALRYCWQHILDNNICEKDCPAECPLNFNLNPVELTREPEMQQGSSDPVKTA